MKVLFIGGTGTISAAIVRRLAEDKNWEVWLLNRGRRDLGLSGSIHQIVADINDEAAVTEALGDMFFDVICEFIGFKVADVERDYRLFKDRTHQYIYTSSASAYQKPVTNYIITEETALSNPYWQYSRDKIACEEFLMKKYSEEGFPVTIVRPSHTYDERKIPVGVHGDNGSWQVIKRMMEGKPVIIQGDGSSLWALTWNDDFAVGYIGLMGNRQAIGEAFQITGDEILTWNQIYQTIADALGVQLNAYHIATDFIDAAAKAFGYDIGDGLLGDKSESVVFDNSKLKRLVPDMCTRVPFHVGAKRALDYIMSHPQECQMEDPDFDQWCDRVIEAQEQAIKELVKETF